MEKKGQAFSRSKLKIKNKATKSKHSMKKYGKKKKDNHPLGQKLLQI